EEITNYLSHLKEKNMPIYPPCVNKSRSIFTVEKDGIRVGMGAIKNVGVGFIEGLVKEREQNGDFVDFEDFVARLANLGINKKNLESMINSGCFDTFGINRPTLLGAYEKVIASNTMGQKAAAVGQITLFDVVPTLKTKFDYQMLADYPPMTKYKYEKEAAGVYLTGHPLQQFADKLKGFVHNSQSFATSAVENDGQEPGLMGQGSEIKDGARIELGGILIGVEKKTTKTGKDMGVARLEDMYGSVEVMVSPNLYDKLKPSFVESEIVKLSGKVNEREGAYTLWVESLQPLDGFVGVESSKASVHGTHKDKAQEKIFAPSQISITEKPKAPQDANPKICCYVSFSKETAEKDQALAILQAYEGECKAYLQDTDTGKNYFACNVNLCPALKMELQGVLDPSKIKIV
ncbi:MAG: hypothetical protein FWD76_05645, partial [Firmicutes bacterium]|nr:hypothetical protein [Bacillota bacterium]